MYVRLFAILKSKPYYLETIFNLSDRKPLPCSVFVCIASDRNDNRWIGTIQVSLIFWNNSFQSSMANSTFSCSSQYCVGVPITDSLLGICR